MSKEFTQPEGFVKVDAVVACADWVYRRDLKDGSTIWIYQAKAPMASTPEFYVSHVHGPKMLHDFESSDWEAIEKILLEELLTGE